MAIPFLCPGNALHEDNHRWNQLDRRYNPVEGQPPPTNQARQLNWTSSSQNPVLRSGEANRSLVSRIVESVELKVTDLSVRSREFLFALHSEDFVECSNMNGVIKSRRGLGSRTMMYLRTRRKMSNKKKAWNWTQSYLKAPVGWSKFWEDKLHLEFETFASVSEWFLGSIVLLCGLETSLRTNSNPRLEIKHCLRYTKPLQVLYDWIAKGPESL